MSKIHIAQIIFVVIEILAFIPLTIEVFGDMEPDIIIVSALVMGIGLFGSCICGVTRAVRDERKK